MKGKQVTLAHAQQLFAQERETVLVSVSPATCAVAVVHQRCAVLSPTLVVCPVTTFWSYVSACLAAKSNEKRRPMPRQGYAGRTCSLSQDVGHVFVTAGATTRLLTVTFEISALRLLRAGCLPWRCHRYQQPRPLRHW